MSVWTKEKPTEPGWYWYWSRRGDHQPEACLVGPIGAKVVTFTGSFLPQLVESYPGEWQPIEPPRE